MENNEKFESYLENTSLPIVVLDQKWHQLFAGTEKPKEILRLEKELQDLLALQGKLGNEEKQLKKIKSDLMDEIVNNMQDIPQNSELKELNNSFDDKKRLIEEVNDKISEIQDQLLDIPKELQRLNKEIMIDTLNFAYHRVLSNTKEIHQLSQWLDKIRVQLKKNMVIKQNREISNRIILTYLNDVFGPSILNLWDEQQENEGEES